MFAANQFGYSKFHYFGVSYGTIVGQYLLKYSPDSLENVVLDSPAVPGHFWVNDALMNVDQLAKKNFNTYASNHLSHLSFNEAVDYLNWAAHQFEKNPFTIELDFGGTLTTWKVDDKIFLKLMAKLLVTIFSENGITHLLWAAENMFTQPDDVRSILKAYVEAFLDPRDEISEIMYQSIICREFPTHTEDVKKSTSHWKFIPRVFGDYVMQEIQNPNRCYLDIPNADQDLVIKNVISTDKSVLVVGGELDHVTIPEYVEQVSPLMPNAYREVFQDVGHGVFMEKPCITNSILDYLRSENGKYSNYCEL